MFAKLPPPPHWPLMHAAGCEHVSGEGLHGGALAHALEARTAGRPGLRWTGPRRRVLEQLIAAATPVKPYELIAGYAPGAAPPKPPTVYRALDFLEREGLVHRVASLGAYVACAVEGEHGAAFLVCTCCSRIEEFRPAGDPAIAAAARQHGFLPAAVTLEVRGVCADCR